MFAVAYAVMVIRARRHLRRLEACALCAVVHSEHDLMVATDILQQARSRA